MNSLKCSVCKEEKSLEEFPRNRLHKHRAGRSYECKSCYRRHKSNQPEATRERRLIKLYGITQADYERMVLEQNGACAICLRIPKYPLFVDHCHKTNKVRGLLCSRCNTHFGIMGDSVEPFERAIAYLKKFSE